MRNSGNLDKPRTTADLDHFYPKEQFPYLALSLYNFVPSCPICNSRFKHKQSSYDKKVLYPYEESFEHEKFRTIFVTSEEVIGNILEKNDFEVILKIQKHVEEKDKTRVKNTIDMFGLNEVYKTSHNDYIRNMLKNIEKRPDQYIESLGKEIFSDLGSERVNEIIKLFKELIKEPYKHRIEEGEPLGKLTKDILEEFGIEL